ncbi:Hypothetical_protein [Hexamita inflata]|uniref:Hypothetical_protein n=1 Tax=Hexamita inflata TaxID=28002 RepID=A0AA86RQ68_9EUKA|nr:Hypothetical protein HINF_LOCUS66538 [Hexamita inflata]
MVKRKQLCKKVAVIVLSPIWFPLGCIFFGIFVPIQLILNNCKIKQYQNSRLKQLLAPQNNQHAQQTQIDDDLTLIEESKQELLLFDLKPVGYLDLKLQITRSKVQLVFEDAVLHSQSVPYNFQGSYFNNFCHKINDSRFLQTKVFEKSLFFQQTEFYQPIHCYGKIFVNIFDFIFTVHNFELKFVAQLPNYYYFVKQAKYETYGGQMFRKNKKLYCHNKSSKLFEIQKNGKLKCVNRKHFNISYYQYHSKVYATDEQKIYIVKRNLQLQPIYNLGQGQLLFFQPGVLFFNSSRMGQKSIVLLNMQDSQIVIQTEFFDFNDQRSVYKLFNKPPIQQHKSYYFSFQFQQNASKLLFNHKLNAKSIKFKLIQQYIQSKVESVNQMIRETVVLNNMIVNSFQNAFVFSDQ